MRCIGRSTYPNGLGGQARLSAGLYSGIRRASNPASPNHGTQGGPA